jgi:arsenate reductase
MKVYYLSTCNTCTRILTEIGTNGLTLQDIKTDKITESQLEEMYKLAGSYDALFSKRAMKYRSMGLNEMELSEEDLKKYILEEYTFLKRPVAIINNEIFIGSAKKTVAELKAAVENAR